MPERRLTAADGFSLLAVAVLGGLALVVMSVGAVALAAEATNDWDNFFVMERTIAAATPVVTSLLVAAVVVGFAAVARW